ncbi:MAG: hypothetical protein IKZ02_01335 [Alphaproteobacteria bacterium]|nr:hypothetical protein [Alphaproteobacteria bacterium]
MLKNEIGRSMVEILGTLSVIGVLSVGGIMGYKFAVDKYQANQTINDINLRALDILIQQSENKPISLDEWENMATIFPIELVFDGETTEERALIQVSNVPQNVCKILVNDMKSRSEVSINGYITEDGSNTDCTDTNTLAFYFGNNEPCGSTYCTSQAPYCYQETQTCKPCITAGHCPSEKPICNNFQCEACPADTPIWNASQQTCVGCETDSDCVGNKLCFPRLQKCYGYSLKSIDDTPNWVYIRINNSDYAGYDEAVYMCNHLGYELPVPTDFISDWDGVSLMDNGVFTPTNIGNAVSANVPKTYYSQVWTSESRGVGINAFWDYYIVYMRDKKELYNFHKTHYAAVVCKPID